MVVESLSAELERLYELEELKALCSSLLGMDPSEVGGASAKGSFARALSQKCVEVEAVDALIDVVLASRRELPQELVKKLRNGAIDASERPQPGDELGEYLIVGELGTSASGSVYRARKNAEDLRVRRLSRELRTRRRDVQRYLAATRVASNATHEGLPSLVAAGALEDSGRLFGVAHTFREGEPLAKWISDRGGRHINELLPLFWALLDALKAVHAQGLVHGALHAGNVLVLEGANSRPEIVLLDAGAHHLRPGLLGLARSGSANWLASASPELLRGDALDARTDVYALGTLIYQTMSGRAPFVGSSPVDVALGHLTKDAESLSFAAAGNGATPEVDVFVKLLMEKDRALRPRDATEVEEGLRRLWRASQRPPSSVADELVEERFQALTDVAWDEQKASEVEALVDLGVPPLRLADGFYSVAREVRAKNTVGSDRIVRKLLARAARLYEMADRHEAAEKLYQGLVKLDPEDTQVVESLDRLRKRLGKFDELIESLIERSDAAKVATERARYFAEIARIYSNEVKDPEQALVAATQAFCFDPGNEKLSEQVEKLAGSRYPDWEEVFSHCLEAMESDLADDAKAALAFQIGRWYSEKVSRPDLALPWLTRSVELEPAHDRALAELAQLYRKAQQWSELGQTLMRRADIAPPNQARDLRAEAADLLVNQLSNMQAAQDAYESILAEDPGHARAAEGFSRLLKAQGDTARALRVLEARAEVLSGEERHKSLLEIAETYEHELDKLADAERAYRQILKDNPKHLDALKGIDRLLTRAARYEDLIETLEAELELAVTARQKIALHERIAKLYDEEFLDHAQAARALEAILELDPSRESAATDLARHLRVLERFEDLAGLYEKQLSLESGSARRVDLGLQLGRVLGEQLKDLPRAIAAYERVLELAPSHAGALEALANLRAASGDRESAVRAVEELAERATTPEARAEQYLRAAALLEEQGDNTGALLRYKLAADACPTNAAITRKVREKYLEHKNYAAAVQLIEEELERTEGSHARAKLAGDLAVLCQRHLKDDKRASAAAQIALHLDPTNPEASRVQGRLAYAEERYVEAAKRLEPSIPGLVTLDAEEAAETAFVYIDSLAESGMTEKAVAAVGDLLELLAKDAQALLAVSELTAAHGSPERALAVCDLLLERHDSELGGSELGAVYRRRGEALFKLGREREAVEALERAIRADSSDAASFRALGKVYAARDEWERVIETRYRELELVQGDERVQTLFEIGDIAASKLNNPDYAARALLLALDERPNDRKILAKLMQLYSAEKDWPQLIEVISRLAEVVDDPKQRAKYLHTAAMLAARELRDPTRAIEFVDLALESDPENEPAFNEGLKLRRQVRDYEGLKEMLKRRAQDLAPREDKGDLLGVLEQLAEIYEQHLQRHDQAVRVYESMLELDRDNPRYQEKISQLYSAEPTQYFEQAVGSLTAWVKRDPYQPTPYKMLRKVYTEARRADGAFLACQALHVLGQAEPDESRFFSRMRDTDPPAIQRSLSAPEWNELIAPEGAEPLLTQLFALVEPFVVKARAEPLEAFGLAEDHRIDAESYPYGLVLATHYAAEALGIPEPPMYQRPEDPGVLGFLPTLPPAILVGGGAFNANFESLQAAFIAGHHIAYYQPGLYLRQLLPNLTALKAWLFAAIRLVKPRFPVTPDLEAPVADSSKVLARLATGAGIEQLTHVVTKLLSSETALDLKRWVHAVDFSADRAGLAVCHDLETVGALIQSVPSAQGSPSVEARLENLMAYSVSERYVELRSRQGVSLD
ncbi:MAG TPA: tetratricopeptide repeat protein [Polyangiaceae bacterium]|nr:tetratricopeptide repeat protein [Polyangiaceae bacterium]